MEFNMDAIGAEFSDNKKAALQKGFLLEVLGQQSGIPAIKLLTALITALSLNGLCRSTDFPPSLYADYLRWKEWVGAIARMDSTASPFTALPFIPRLVGDGVTDDTIALQAAIDSLAPGDTLRLRGDHKISSSLNIRDKTRIRITGKGKLFLSGASADSDVFNLTGTINGLEIDSLELVGEANAKYKQSAIGNDSGQNITNCRFHDLTISNINIGISLNAAAGGSYSDSLIYNNKISNLYGKEPGQGYGIHLANAKNCDVYHNTIRQSTRHAIYQAMGDDCNNKIIANTILDHRLGVSDQTFKAAISCARSSGVTIALNRFYGGSDCSLEIAHDTALGLNCSDIKVIGNTFKNRRNLVPDILIGQQAEIADAQTSDIEISNNTFHEDISMSGGGTTISILHGHKIVTANNEVHKTNAQAVLGNFLTLGDYRFATNDSHISDIIVSGNVGFADAIVSGSRFIYIGSQLCTGSSKLTIKSNEFSGFAALVNFAATLENENAFIG